RGVLHGLPHFRTYATKVHDKSPMLLITREEQAKYPVLAFTQEFPPFDIDPETIVPAFELLLDRIEKQFTQRANEFQPTWEGTLGKIEDLEQALEKTYGLVTHLNGVKNTPALRQALETIQPRVVQTNLLMQQSKSLYDALSRLHQDTQACEALGPVRQRVVTQRLQAMELSGVGLTPESPEHHRFTKVMQNLSALSQRFSNHVLDATKEFSLAVQDEKRLQGCSVQLRTMLANNARRRGHSDATADQGPWVITLDYPVYGPFMMTCQDRDLRYEVYRAYVTRASTNTLDNSPLLSEILALRQELASLLGYSSYAELSLRSKMAGEVSVVRTLLENLYQAAFPVAQQEVTTLNQFARDQLGMPDPLQAWDVPFVSEQYRKHLSRFDENEISQYFPFPKVLAGMFQLAEELFGIRVERVTQVSTQVDSDGTVETVTPAVWHPDVQLFRAQDSKTGETLAYFYGDFYSRPEEKNGGAWMNICTTRHMDPITHSVRVPVAYLICNQAPPMPDQPSLMKYRDVQTLFHEFGHCLQHMLTRVDIPQASGLNGVEWDFIEVASQFMENFCYETTWLQRLSGNYQTGQPMPLDMVHALQSERRFLQGLATLRQLHFGMVDMALHHQYDPKVESPFEVDHRIAQRTQLFPQNDFNKFLCSFSHIFAGGYAAGYYSYKWSEVYSADGYAAVEEASNVEARRQVCQRYRDTVLSLGGGTPPHQIWEAFRGRATADISALVRHCGLQQ
ncbi:hypothetical protein IWQ61_002393, partial [Dispira simplex]